MTPQFKHDCDKCRLIAQTPQLDFYRCSTSVLARASNDPPDYTSYPLDVIKDASTSAHPVVQVMIGALRLDGWKHGS